MDCWILPSYFLDESIAIKREDSKICNTIQMQFLFLIMQNIIVPHIVDLNMFLFDSTFLILNIY